MGAVAHDGQHPAGPETFDFGHSAVLEGRARLALQLEDGRRRCLRGGRSLGVGRRGRGRAGGRGHRQHPHPPRVPNVTPLHGIDRAYPRKRRRATSFPSPDIRMTRLVRPSRLPGARRPNFARWPSVARSWTLTPPQLCDLELLLDGRVRAADRIPGPRRTSSRCCRRDAPRRAVRSGRFRSRSTWTRRWRASSSRRVRSRFATPKARCSPCCASTTPGRSIAAAARAVYRTRTIRRTRRRRDARAWRRPWAVGGPVEGVERPRHDDFAGAAADAGRNARAHPRRAGGRAPSRFRPATPCIARTSR